MNSQALIQATEQSPRLAQKTKDNYLAVIRDFLEFSRTSHLDPKYAARAWVEALSTRGLEVSSISTMVKALKSAAGRYAALTGDLDFTQGLEAPRKVRKIIPGKALTVEEVARLLKTCEGPNIRDQRDRAIFGLILYSGLRRNGVKRLDVDDLDRRKGLMKVYLKGDHEFEAPILSPMIEYLEPWMDRLRKLERPDRSLFCSLSPKNPPGKAGGRLSYSSYQKIFSRRGREADIVPLGAHRLRHTFVTHALRRGWQDWQIATVSGHSMDSRIIPNTYKDLTVLRGELPNDLYNSN